MQRKQIVVFAVRCICVFILSIAFFSCSKTGSNDNIVIAPITGFNFLSSNNNIPVDANASINGSDIEIFLPPGTNKNALIATYTVPDNSVVKVNGVIQNDGVTPNNFNQPVVYAITTPDGKTQNCTVTLTTDIQSIDDQVVQFMNTYNVPALSLAITKDEQLVYAKAYGQADLEAKQAATTQNLFRIASLSKQLTSIAIMRLMDMGKISMQDKVFGLGSILGFDYGTQPYGPGITDITIDELLHHTCGGWSNDDTTYPDPMFTNPNMTAQQLISWTLDNIPLEYIPGTNYDYSNFGYCILGRVIEKITDMPYTIAVQSLVLKPSGVTDMKIGGNTLAQRYSNEVKYYGQSGENPYIYNITRMDSHGGWIASATDLARVLVHVDGQSGNDILSPQAITTMTTPSIANQNYACGWATNGVNWWHTGSLPGTSGEQAITVQAGNFNFVILTNTRSLDNNYSSDMDQLFWNAQANTTNWPTYDLFQ